MFKIFVGSGGSNGKSHSKDIVQDCADEDSTIAIEESGVSDSERHNNKNNSSFKQNNLAAPIGSKQRQKLHWGYDAPLVALCVCGCSCLRITIFGTGKIHSNVFLCDT